MTANCVTNLFKEAAAELQENQEMTLSKNTQLPPLKKSIIIVNRESRLTIPIVYLQPHGNTAGHQLVAQHDIAGRNKKKIYCAQHLMNVGHGLKISKETCL